MSNVILLIQWDNNPDSRNQFYFDSVNDCLEGVCRIYEEHLKRQNPYAPIITYDITELFDYIDQLTDLHCLVYHTPLQMYVPFNREWVIEKIYMLLCQQGP